MTKLAKKKHAKYCNLGLHDSIFCVLVDVLGKEVSVLAGVCLTGGPSNFFIYFYIECKERGKDV